MSAGKSNRSGQRPELTTKAIIEELQGEVVVYQHSYRETDGKVHNPGALRTIAALKGAINVLKCFSASPRLRGGKAAR